MSLFDHSHLANNMYVKYKPHVSGQNACLCTYVLELHSCNDPVIIMDSYIMYQNKPYELRTCTQVVWSYVH